MSEIDELRAQVAALKDRLDMEAGLRASQDGDLADIRLSMQAQSSLIQALAITQSQHTSAMARLERGIQSILGLLTELLGREGSQ